MLRGEKPVSARLWDLSKVTQQRHKSRPARQCWVATEASEVPGCTALGVSTSLHAALLPDASNRPAPSRRPPPPRCTCRHLPPSRGAARPTGPARQLPLPGPENILPEPCYRKHFPKEWHGTEGRRSGITAMRGCHAPLSQRGRKDRLGQPPSAVGGDGPGQAGHTGNSQDGGPSLLTHLAKQSSRPSEPSWAPTLPAPTLHKV